MLNFNTMTVTHLVHFPLDEMEYKEFYTRVYRVKRMMIESKKVSQKSYDLLDGLLNYFKERDAM